MAGENLVYLETFGCQMNEHDSQHLTEGLQGNGYKLTDDIAKASVVLLNTCSVREGPENKIRSYLGRIRKLKAKNSNLIIGVGGCVAQQEKENILRQEKVVDLVFGPDNLLQVPQMIAKAKSGVKQLQVGWNKQALEQLSQVRFSSLPTAGRAFIAITKGCDNFCSFCIVPYTRGREVSRSLESIIAEAEHLIKLGAKEITLVGQNVNSYQHLETDFLQLLKKVADLSGLERLRFISPHPKDWNENHSKLLAEHPTICNQLHLPFQAGSSRILKLMRRDHDIKSYLNKIKRLKELVPDICLSTDIIVGFPSETDEDFQQTLAVLKEVEFSQVYAFKYSPRPGTKASRMDDDISLATKEQRLSILLAEQNLILKKKLQSYVGKKLAVMINSVDKRQNQCHGKSEGNISINIPSTDLNAGEIYPMIITAANQNSLMAKSL